MTKITSGERMAKIEERLTNVHDNLKQHCVEQREDFDKVLKKLDNMEKVFAGKWVEKFAIGTLIALISGILIILIQTL